MLKFINIKNFLRLSLVLIVYLFSSNIIFSMEKNTKKNIINNQKYNVTKDTNLEKRQIKQQDSSRRAFDIKKICTKINLAILSAYILAENNSILPDSIDINSLELVQFIKEILNLPYRDQKVIKCLIKLAGHYFLSNPRNYSPDKDLINRALDEAILVDHQRAIDLILIFKNNISVNKLNIEKILQNKSLTLLSVYNIAKSHIINIDGLPISNELKDLAHFIRGILNSPYKDYKAVKCIIKLKTDPEYKPSQKLLDRAVFEASIANDERAKKLFLTKRIHNAGLTIFASEFLKPKPASTDTCLIS